MATQEPKFNIKEFDGVSGDAESWLRKFKLISKELKWDVVDNTTHVYKAKTQMGIHLTGMAGLWFDNLEAGKTDTMTKLCDEFEKRFTKGDSRVVLEHKLASLKLNSEQDIESYYAEIIKLGDKLTRPKESLAINFVSGLPENMKSYCVGTDKHDLESYKARAKFFKAMEVHQNRTPDTPAPIEDDDSLNAFQENYRNQQPRGRGYRGSRRGTYPRNQNQQPGRYQDNSDRNGWRGNRRPNNYRGRPGRGRAGRYNNYRGRGAGFQGQHQQNTQQQQHARQTQQQKRCHGCQSTDHLKANCPYGDSNIKPCQKCFSKTHTDNDCPFF